MARPIGGTPSYSGVPEQSVDCWGALSEASNIPKNVALISGATFLLLVLLLRLPSLVSLLYLALFHRPMTERRPRELRLNSLPPKKHISLTKPEKG